jgi:hypothetical protein
MNKQNATSQVYTTLHQIVQLIPHWMILMILRDSHPFIILKGWPCFIMLKYTTVISEYTRRKVILFHVDVLLYVISIFLLRMQIYDN